MRDSNHVRINSEKLDELVEKLEKESFAYGNLDEYHFDTASIPKERIVAFVCIIDSINFCFWPLEGFEYEHLIAPFKTEISNESSQLFSADFLSELTCEGL